MTLTHRSPAARRKASRTVTAMVGFVALALATAACGGKAPASAGSNGDSLKVGVFVDNAFGDGDFFDQAAKAQKPL
jgi:basic membrane protein A and related proteins